MNRLRELIIKIGLAKPKPHEKAEIGQGNWGRQEATAKPTGTISARVIRKDGTIEDLGIISGGK